MTSPRTGSVGLASMSKNSGGVPTAIGQIASSKVYNPLGYIWDRNTSIKWIYITQLSTTTLSKESQRVSSFREFVVCFLPIKYNSLHIKTTFVGIWF